MYTINTKFISGNNNFIFFFQIHFQFITRSTSLISMDKSKNPLNLTQEKAESKYVYAKSNF